MNPAEVLDFRRLSRRSFIALMEQVQVQNLCFGISLAEKGAWRT
jgi:hypothetical protein